LRVPSGRVGRERRARDDVSVWGIVMGRRCRISALGERRRVRAIEIVGPVELGEEHIRVLGPGDFSGEINMLSARRTLVRAVTLPRAALTPRFS